MGRYARQSRRGDQADSGSLGGVVALASGRPLSGACSAAAKKVVPFRDLSGSSKAPGSAPIVIQMTTSARKAKFCLSPECCHRDDNRSGGTLHCGSGPGLRLAAVDERRRPAAVIREHGAGLCIRVGQRTGDGPECRKSGGLDNHSGGARAGGG